MGRFSEAPVDRAAGGVVVRGTGAARTVAVVHRPRHDDWSLPKGHVDAGESWREAALREVREETGWRATVTGAPMSISYLVGDDLPKVVVFYPMATIDEEAVDEIDADEVDEIAWWPVARAVAELTYEDERRVASRLA